MNPDWQGAVARAETHSPFLARALSRQPELRDLLARGDAKAARQWVLHQGRSEEDIGASMRRERLAVATSVAIGDLAGAFPLAEVVEQLSEFADRWLDRAINQAIAERTGEADATGLIGLALGKQGARELNYSSDIDPILLYDPDRLIRRGSDDPGEAAQRYARRIVKLLSENTAEGYVLRVDLRLRPASEISPLAVPRGSALAHYQGQALAWERAAYIRARAAAGDIAAGAQFLSEIAPFVWRSALDFGAIEAIRALTQRIRDSHDGPARPAPGFDVKRGRGGIREIEFFAQTHQLIHGGRDPSLRVRGTRAALDALAAAGQIGQETARLLGDGYDRLREIEHRLQMVHDRQTHSLPDGEALDHVARLDGLADGDELIDELQALTEATGGIYDSLIEPETKTQSPSVAPTQLEQNLVALGFDDVADLAARIEEWRDGRYPSIRSPQALEAFDRLLSPLLEVVAQSDDPTRALTRWERILEQAPSAIGLFRLLHAKPALLKRLIDTLTLAQPLADELARRPELLDVLLDARPVDFTDYATLIGEKMGATPGRADYEARLDNIRRVTGEERFSLGVRLIEGEDEPMQIGAALAASAEAAIGVAVEAATAEFTRAHGTIAGSELIVLGLGRLGGGLLTHASDLDMIYLFTGDFAAQSSGPRTIGATLYFNRLASRVSAALSVPTAQGALYEVDTRLRPQGNQGPLAVSLDAFAKYQSESAWTWEHMALTRARVLAGSVVAREQVDATIASVLMQKRNRDELRAAVLKMRDEMARHKHPRGEMDVKLLRGGLVDIEFLTHVAQLQHAHELALHSPAMLDPRLSIAIAALESLDVLEPGIAAAHSLMTNALIAGRLLAPDGKRPPTVAAKALARACNRDTYAELIRDLTVARQNIARVWTEQFEQSLELDHE